jgi:hypothetical protein
VTAHAADTPAALTAWDIAAVVCSTAAIVVTVVGLAWLPGLLAPAGAVLALAAAAMSPRWRAYSATAVGVAGVGFVVDMTVALFTHHRLF